jgi:energy-coupling factor transporter ATP-binding protein EcfA2
VIARPGRCVALMGESGAGKSTLAAFLVSRGARLVTDDLLRVTVDGPMVLAYPGPRRIKLMPDSRERYLGAQAEGVPMHPLSGKFILPLEPAMTHEGLARLDEVFLLDWPPDGVPEPRVETPSQRDAMLRVIAGTGVVRVTDAARLARQFEFAQALVSRVPVRRLLQPNDLDRLPETAALIGFP